jgi:hypothetical protein
VTTLADFLLARIAEDEADARRAAAADGLGPVWRAGTKWEDMAGIYANGGEVADMPDTDVAPHIARWDPARVLAECDAKRRIVTECGWVTVMALLALPYADHEDYRQEWKP